MGDQPAAAGAAASAGGLVAPAAEAEASDAQSDAALAIALVGEAYLAAAGTWLARLDPAELNGLGARIVSADALPETEWSWIKELLPALG